MWRLPVLRPIASPARLACWFALVATTLAPGAMHAIDTRLYPIDPSKGDGIGEYVSEANLDLIVARVVAVSDRGATIATGTASFRCWRATAASPRTIAADTVRASVRQNRATFEMTCAIWPH